MRILFCDSGFSHKEVDLMYAEEFQSAKNNLFELSLISFEELKRGDIDAAIKRVNASEEVESGIYRGWMLMPSQYEGFYNKLLEKNIKLINSPEEYKFCHYLPENYKVIETLTPKTTFKKIISEFTIDDFIEQINEFGDKPIIVKDYVKSQKHYWKEACFIPRASDREKAESVIQKFIELQDTDINEGLVFREYVELEELTNHPESGMPLTKEFRIFVKYGKIMIVFNYWDEGDYQNVKPVLDEFETIIPKIKSNFFTMDIAKKKDGSWIIVELGDGQVAGLPDNVDKDEFYTKLKNS